MHVLYIAPFAQRTGYAQAAHDYMLALHRAGISMEIQPVVQCDTDDLEERYEELLPLVRGYPGHISKQSTHVIVHTVPAHAHRFSSPAQKRIAITTWETSFAPAQITGSLGGNFDHVVVPSEFCAHSLTGLKVPLSVIGHCFDPEHWPAPEEPPENSPFVFYSVLGWSERKNPIGLLKAFLGEFSARDDVLLRLKVSGYSERDIELLQAASGLPREQLPRIEIITEHFDHEEMIDFHHEGNCFVTAARGEGWNLPAFEAALMGNPIIAPRFGGHLDFLAKQDLYWDIPFQLTPAITPPVIKPQIELGGLNIRPVVKVEPLGITARQRWVEPDLDGLGRTMRCVYEDRPARDFSTRRDLVARFSYERVGRQLIEVLK